MAIVGLVLGGIWIAATQMLMAYKVNLAVQQFTILYEAARKLYPASYTNDLSAGQDVTSVFARTVKLPGSPSSNSYLYTPWAYNITIEIGPYTIDRPGRFNIIFYGVPETACEQFVRKVYSLFYDYGPFDSGIACPIDPSRYDNGDGYIRRCPLMVSMVYNPQNCTASSGTNKSIRFNLPLISR